MKKIIRYFLINFVSLFLVSELINAVSFSSFFNLALASIYLTILNLILKPILNFILTPFAFLTLGFLRLIINSLTLFLADIFVEGFQVISFSSPSLTIGKTQIPSQNVTLFWSYILVSFIIELFSNLIIWIFKE